MDKVQVEIFGLSTTSGPGGAYAILLKETNSNRKLPIIIGAFEAQAIALELEGIKPPRPLTHDLTKTIIEYFGATLNEVIITELRENTFYAKLLFEMSSINYEIDSRPSDAIALAVRFRCPIYVNLTLMNEAGFETSSEDDEMPNLGEETSESPSSKNVTKDSVLANLQSQLRESLEKEEYERAAKLRDEIKKIIGEDIN